MTHPHTLADLARCFAEPPRDYSPVPIWWWSGERLERPRLRWQLEHFAAGGIFNLVILNLAPTGPLYGADADDPPFFSAAWWEIFLDVCADARELGVRLWVYDQIGFSGANLQGQLVRDHPMFAGQWLDSVSAEGDGPLELICPPEGEPLVAVLIPPDGGVPTPVALDGRRAVDHRPDPRRLRLIYAVRRGFNYFSADACATLLETVHGAYERWAYNFLGDVIVGSFQDELPSLPTWDDGFFAAFEARAGYELRPRLGLLWDGDNAEAQRVRADYHAVRATLAEDAFFKPLFAWHERHGLICGFDQQGPARAGDPIGSVRLYADYLRTHRWFGAPGSDHHGEAKIHSSLAHLYDRPRVWIEAFHSSGWGGTLEETFDWLLPWLRAGATLYDPHAVYYSTRGGWWEWAPPSTCWRQPYWRHYRPFADAVSRLCFLLSQGQHVCDIGVLFPTTTIQAQTTPTGPLPAARAAHDAYRALVGSMVWFDVHVGVLDRDRRDYDVLDDDAVQRGELRDQALVIGAERYRAIVLPHCTVLTAATAAVLARFVEAGGLLIAVGAAPELACGGDAEPVQQLRHLFSAGRATLIADAEELPAALEHLHRQVDAPVPTLHRCIGDRAVLFVPAAFPRATEERYNGNWLDVDYTFDPERYQRRMTVQVRGVRGGPQLWNPLTGERLTLPATPIDDGVAIQVPFDSSPAALLVWPAAGEDEQLPAAMQRAAVPGVPIERWEATLEPTMDNRFGDLDRPAYPGSPPVQTWTFAHLVTYGDERATDTLPTAGWTPAEATFGTYGWWLGPRRAADLPERLEALAAGRDPLQVAGWQPAVYSLSRGIARDPLHRQTLGPKGHVPQEFLAFGALRAGEAIRFRTTIWLPDAQQLHLALGAAAAKRAWINGESIGVSGPGYHWLTPIALRAGSNLLEWELVAETPIALRASWALVRRPDRYVCPEWMTGSDTPVRDSQVRFSTTLDLTFTPTEATVQVGAGVPCRVLINGAEIGRQGGFDPYDGSPRVQHYTTGALRRGANAVTVEAQDHGTGLAVVVDGLVRGAAGEQAQLVSGATWRVQRDDGAETPATPCRRQWVAPAYGSSEISADMDPAFTHVWRRPHPLPGAAWLEDQPDDGTVLPVVPDAYARRERGEWFRWTIPFGAAEMTLPVRGTARVWIEGTTQPIVDGTVMLPASAAHTRTALLHVVPEAGRSGGSVFDGPVTYRHLRGPIALVPWAELGLESYSGGVRYHATFTVTEAASVRALDLGQVRGTAEVWVNGAPAGVRFLAPYAFDLGGLLRSGENTLEVLVCNTLAPYLRAVSPTHYIYPGQVLSGLLGPVTLAHVQPTRTTMLGEDEPFPSIADSIPRSA